jgi:1-acyl-sn-glycerol-3-phosphate acyltransferase
MFPRMMRWFFNVALTLLTMRDVEGLENIPEAGPYIITANHVHYLDLPLLYSVVGGEHVTGWAAAKYRKHPLIGPIIRLGRGIFIRRGEVDREALKAAVDWLASGKVFGMSPEGTRSKTNALGRGKTGAAYLAHFSGVPILPVALTGTETLLRKLARLRRPKLTIRIGKPFRLPPLDGDLRAANLRQHTDEIMCRIAALLPPAYRGVYSDHPRLNELLAEVRA